ncbi:IclR family transcriptional regulator [Mycolicibacterium goodii]|uniref:IclR family transcriptional regulator n=1 Tax=Mycolicibacterium goodii TaxID=134601 RepID=A0A0K0X3R2_MYCGD|nr:hypothetical protein AFA91_09625 [Mycolicibacterium goodii]
MADDSVLRKPTRRLVPSVLTAMRVLGHISSEGHVRGNHVATALGLNPSTCHEVLKTLLYGGYLDYDAETREYSIGPVIATMAARSLSTDTIIAAVRPALRQWVRETQFTAFVARWLPDQTVLVVDKVESTKEIKMTLEVGQRFPPTAAALGKSFMAFMDPDELHAVLDSLELPAYTERSIGDRRSWESELQRVRQCGWSESSREFYSSTNSVVSPVFDPSGRVQFVIGSLAAATDLTDERLAEFGAKMRDLAIDVQVRLFGTAARPSGRDFE